jgi:hypothetical protein
MAEKIVLEGSQARVTGGVGAEVHADLTAFIHHLCQENLQGYDPEALADNVKWKVVSGPATVCIVELKPQLRRLMWIDPKSPVPYGAGATYKERRLATPYIVLKVPFLKGKIIGRAELFYRNEPLRSLDDQLYWSNLLNVSPNAYGCIAWVCTQYLGTEKMAPGITGGLDALVHHLFGGGFNKSSERHEGASAFSKAQSDKLDLRVTDVDRWEAESVKDPRFVLSIPWRPIGMTVGQLIHAELAKNGPRRNLGNVAELVTVLQNSRNGK